MVYAAAIGLSPAAFVQLSERDNGGTEHTSESRMLEASRKEIRKEVSEDVTGWRWIRDSLILGLDLYIWEPLCTGFRFLHLVIIFVPVIVTVPALWIGRRVKDKSDKRTGTLWWYWFLVKSMERAGPAFIKVLIAKITRTPHNYANMEYSLDNGQLPGRIFSPQRCARSCPSYTLTHLHIPYSKLNALYGKLLMAEHSRTFSKSLRRLLSEWVL